MFQDGMTTEELIEFLNEDPPPASQLLGVNIQDLDAETGTSLVEFIGREEFLNKGGSIQGGILAAMLDTVMSLALVARFQGTCRVPTIEFKITFINPAAPGPIRGEGRVVSNGRVIGFMEGSLFGPQGELLATSTGTARIIPRYSQDPPPGDHP